MNESEFEKNLAALHPTAPSPKLAERIREELAKPAPVGTGPRAGLLGRPMHKGLILRMVRDFGWACAGAATAFAMIAIAHHWQAPIPQSVEPTAASMTRDDAFEHAETIRELVSTEDSSELLETEEGPVRQIRYSYLERHAWANPRTGARVELEVPREDVFLLPVSMQ